MKGTKVQKHKSVKMAWERGTNGYCYLLSVAILWCPRCWLPEDRGNNETHSLAPTELFGLEGFGFHFPQRDHHQWIRYTLLLVEESIWLEEFIISIMVKQSVAQSIITQRPRFTRKSPVVAAATVLPKFILIYPSSFFLVGSLKCLSLSGVYFFILLWKWDTSKFIHAMFIFS